MTAYGINDSGLIVGTYRTGGGARDGFLYFPNNGGTYVTLDHPLAVNGTAVGTDVYGINNSGQLVGTYYDANLKPHGFALFDFLAGYTAIDDPLGTEGTFATGINDARFPLQRRHLHHARQSLGRGRDLYIRHQQQWRGRRDLLG
jgi:hypothetical protein